MEATKDQILEYLERKNLSQRTKDKLLDMLIELEIKEKVNHPAYPTLTSRYGKGEGLNFIANYVRSLVEHEGFGIGSAIAQFDSNF